jgi:hypothetical protein
MTSIETLHEPITVRADFRNGKIIPLVFRRGQQTLRIVKVNAQWQQQETDNRRYCFSVQADTGDTFELHLDGRNMQWWVDRVCLDT